ncbi:MAG: hypothetical protein EA382_09010 [Spirochaetaceae bacterium]|nr:MAG: hypothetical protein EA382_09010 [Spirochaetaceae bacterium]
MKQSWLDRYPPVDKDRDADTGTSVPVHPTDLPVEARIDLHGMRLEEALAATRRFIDECSAARYRKIVVIHGKGAGGNGVLKREIRAYVERDPRVGRTGYSKGNEGGTGALWLLLKRPQR